MLKGRRFRINIVTKPDSDYIFYASSSYDDVTLFVNSFNEPFIIKDVSVEIKEVGSGIPLEAGNENQDRQPRH